MTDVRRSSTGDGLVVTVPLRGEIDVVTAEAITAVLHDPELARASCLRFDLRAVTFMDSQGVRALLDVQRSVSAQGMALAVVEAPRQVRRLLAITGADRVIDVVD